jgi:hypothetical protein
MTDYLWWGEARVAVIENLGISSTGCAGVNAKLYFACSSFWFWNFLDL